MPLAQVRSGNVLFWVSSEGHSAVLVAQARAMFAETTTMAWDTNAKRRTLCGTLRVATLVVTGCLTVACSSPRPEFGHAMADDAGGRLTTRDAGEVSADTAASREGGSSSTSSDEGNAGESSTVSSGKETFGTGASAPEEQPKPDASTLSTSESDSKGREPEAAGSIDGGAGDTGSNELDASETEPADTSDDNSNGGGCTAGVFGHAVFGQACFQ